MHWQTDDADQRHLVPDDVVDVAFAIACRTLPVEHAWDLWQALRAVVPWLVDEPGAGVHPLHVADSAHGWVRPDRPDDLLHPSRRTRLIVRVPRHRVPDTELLSGRVLDIAGHEMTLAEASVRPLSDLTTLYARYVVAREMPDEQAFLEHAIAELRRLAIEPKKMLCGIERTIRTPEGAFHTRSLMLADLSVAESVRLQQTGLGPLRHLGCGLFVPHKGVSDVSRRAD